MRMVIVGVVNNIGPILPYRGNMNLPMMKMKYTLPIAILIPIHISITLSKR